MQEIHSTTFSGDTTAGYDDALVYYDNPYKIWEYPLFADNTTEPARYITVIFPDVTQSSMPSGKAGAVCQEGWYAPSPQPYNVWSYDPVGQVRFPDYDSDNQIAEKDIQGTEDEFQVYFKDITEVIATSSQYHSVSRDEASLRLYRCTAATEAGLCIGGWEEAHLTCGVDAASQPLYPVERFVEDNLILVPVCETSLFALSDETPPSEWNVFLPVVPK